MSERHEPKYKMDEDLFRLRHSLSHVLAQAVLQLRPRAKLGFGPPIRTGFYYDFLLDEPISEADLPEIEERMRRILQEGQTFQHEDLAPEEALKRLEALGQDLKQEYAKELLQEHPKLSFYRNGPFVDMCEGPHVSSTKDIPPDCFRLDSIAGSYWRGDSRKPMLTPHLRLVFPNEGRTGSVSERTPGSLAARSPKARPGIGNLSYRGRSRQGASALASERHDFAGRVGKIRQGIGIFGRVSARGDAARGA